MQTCQIMLAVHFTCCTHQPWRRSTKLHAVVPLLNTKLCLQSLLTAAFSLMYCCCRFQPMTHLWLSLQEVQELKAQLADANKIKAQTTTVGTSPIKSASGHSINLSPFSAEMRKRNPNSRFAALLKSIDKVSKNLLVSSCLNIYLCHYTDTECSREHRRPSYLIKIVATHSPRMCSNWIGVASRDIDCICL